MSWRRILVLLVLVAAVGTYIWVRELPQAEKEGKKEKLLAVDRTAVSGITLAYADRRIELRKKDDTWRLSEPVDAVADEATTSALLGVIVDAEVQKTLDEPLDLASFGLDKPTVTVTLTLQDGTQTPAIAVGKNTSIGGKTYVRKGDEPKVHLTASSFQLGLNKQPKDFRDKALFAFQDDDVTRVEISPTGGETTTLVRKDKDAWTVEPGANPADPTEVRSYLGSLRATRATDFPDDLPSNLAKYGLDKPRLAVTIATGKDKDEKTRTLLLGGESTDGTPKVVYAKRVDQPAIYAVGEWSFRTLNKTAGGFRDKTVLAFDPARVGRAAVERKGAPGVTLVRGEGGWTIEGAEAGKEPNDAAISRFFDDLHELRGSDIVAEPASDLSRFGLDGPDVRITLTDKEGQPIGTVLAAKHDGKAYVMQAGGSAVFEARDYMFARLDKQPAEFIEGGIPTTQPKAATAPVPAPPVADEPEDDGEDEE